MFRFNLSIGRVVSTDGNKSRVHMMDFGVWGKRAVVETYQTVVEMTDDLEFRVGDHISQVVPSEGINGGTSGPESGGFFKLLSRRPFTKK